MTLRNPVLAAKMHYEYFKSLTWRTEKVKEFVKMAKEAYPYIRDSRLDTSKETHSSFKIISDERHIGGVMKEIEIPCSFNEFQASHFLAKNLSGMSHISTPIVFEN